MRAHETDTELVQQFLRIVSRFSGQEIRRLTRGEITEHDVSRWRRGSWKTLTEPKRDAVRGFIHLHEQGTLGDVVATELENSSVPKPPPDWRTWLRERIDVIEALDIPEWHKTLRIDAVGSLVWAEAAREAEHAAGLRAEAMRMAVAGQADRARQLVADVPYLDQDRIDRP